MLNGLFHSLTYTKVVVRVLSGRRSQRMLRGFQRSIPLKDHCDSPGSETYDADEYKFCRSLQLSSPPISNHDSEKRLGFMLTLYQLFAQELRADPHTNRDALR